MNINIKATNIDLTNDLKMYIEEKMNSLDKYFNNIIEVRVEVGSETEHHQKGAIFFCEVNVKVPNDLIRIRKTEENVFKAIDKVRDHFKVTLHRHKEKLQEKSRGGSGEKLDIEDIREMEGGE